MQLTSRRASSRFWGSSRPCDASARSDWGQHHVGALVEHQRILVATVLEALDLAEKQHVVAGHVLGELGALEGRDAVLDDRHVVESAWRQATPANLSAIWPLAKRVDSSVWSSARMLIANASAPRNASRLRLLTRRLHDTSGGSSETEANELQVSPIGWPSESVVVMIATPVGKLPSALRKARTSNPDSTPDAADNVGRNRGGRGHAGSWRSNVSRVRAAARRVGPAA